MQNLSKSKSYAIRGYFLIWALNYPCHFWFSVRCSLKCDRKFRNIISIKILSQNRIFFFAEIDIFLIFKNRNHRNIGNILTPFYQPDIFYKISPTKLFFKGRASYHFKDYEFFSIVDKKILKSNFDFWPKFRFLTKFSIFDQKFHFLTEISMFVQSFYFSLKLRFLTEISIFVQNFNC